MKSYLRSFSLGGSWEPLLEHLPGWTRHTLECWSDGESTIGLSEDGGKQKQFGFHVDDKRIWEVVSRLADEKFGEAERGSSSVRFTSPSGVRLLFCFVDRTIGSGEKRTLVMNHFAANVSELDVEQQWFEKLLGPSTVLARTKAWDPVSQSWSPDVHLYRSTEFYITLRGRQDAQQVDHIGWMADTPSFIDKAADLLKSIGWPIVLGPTHIDGSYLVHFRGPDGKIHDFFYPEPNLVTIDRL